MAATRNYLLVLDGREYRLASVYAKTTGRYADLYPVEPGRGGGIVICHFDGPEYGHLRHGGPARLLAADEIAAVAALVREWEAEGSPDLDRTAVKVWGRLDGDGSLLGRHHDASEHLRVGDLAPIPGRRYATDPPSATYRVTEVVGPRDGYQWYRGELVEGGPDLAQVIDAAAPAYSDALGDHLPKFAAGD
jgi:hypothetical protein